MKYHFFNGEIKEENTNKLFDFINQNQDEEMTIFIDSSGGSNFFTNPIIEVLNNHKEKIKLVSSGYIYSNAFLIFFLFEGKKELLREIQGMFHYSGRDFRLTENGKLEYTQEIFELGELKKSKLFSEKFAEDLGFTDKEMKKLKSNKNVYFSKERLEELLNNQLN